MKVMEKVLREALFNVAEQVPEVKRMKAVSITSKLGVLTLEDPLLPRGCSSRVDECTLPSEWADEPRIENTKDLVHLWEIKLLPQILSISYTTLAPYTLKLLHPHRFQSTRSFNRYFASFGSEDIFPSTRSLFLLFVESFHYPPPMEPLYPGLATLRLNGSYTRAIGDVPRHFEPWSRDEDDTSPNYHTTPMGGRFSSRHIQRASLPYMEGL
ncbi:hypothetical protein TNCV_4272811 [Trichonephila clavipes]|nr:hypothetical protein TNCV_4272811 [Trichonephila clavipes]